MTERLNWLTDCSVKLCSLLLGWWSFWNIHTDLRNNTRGRDSCDMWQRGRFPEGSEGVSHLFSSCICQTSLFCWDLTRQQRYLRFWWEEVRETFALLLENMGWLGPGPNYEEIDLEQVFWDLNKAQYWGKDCFNLMGLLFTESLHILDNVLYANKMYYGVRDLNL